MEGVLASSLLSGDYLGRQLSRGSCQIVSLLSAPLLQDSHKACVLYAGYTNHMRRLVHSRSHAETHQQDLVLFLHLLKAEFFVLLSCYCPLVAEVYCWHCMILLPAKG